MTYFTSDLHLGHKNLIEGLRGMSVDECDELIVQNWNNIVTSKDTVFLLGDISMDKPQIVAKYLPKLNGIIKVIAGNHDSFQVCKALYDLGIQVCGGIKFDNFYLSHVPIHEAELSRYGRITGNIHGHIHLSGALHDEEQYELPKDKYFNVNCEFHNYTPISYDVILDYFNNL